MDRSSVPCPAWLADRLEQVGGPVSFQQFMDWSLNDPDHGAYGSGQLRIGPAGDFVTSPSLGSDFAQLLAVQVAQWLLQIRAESSAEQILTLVEIGPGEGDLAADLITTLAQIHPELLGQLQLVLVEANAAMVERQRKRLAGLPSVVVQWLSLAEMAASPVTGVLLAHEVLDALPVERLVWRGQQLFRQGVALINTDQGAQLCYRDLPLPPDLRASLERGLNQFGVSFPPESSPDGWCSEWHSGLGPWFSQAAAALARGTLLVIDYALEARRYYSLARSNGTLIAYRNQQASGNLLREPGLWDLTAHLCIETLVAQALAQGWLLLGEVRQGQALLALGLAERLHALQGMSAEQLPQALQRREALLRLVDPAGLGDFRWLAFEIATSQRTISSCRFLEEPSREDDSGRP
ncbi:MAG: class I SAM-dependent methyltransferase [Prochlorococcus sp.]